MKIHKSTIYAFGELCHRLGKALAAFLLAYLVTKEEYGVYSYLLAASAILTALLDSGLNTMVVLRASVQRFRKLFKIIALGKIAVFAVVMVGLLTWQHFSPLFPNLSVPPLAPFIAISLAVDLQAFLANSLRARLDYGGDAMVKVIGTLGFLLLLGAVRLSEYKLDAITALWLQSTTLFVAIAAGTWRLRGAHASFARMGSHATRGVWALLAISVPFAISSFCGSFFNTIDTLMLGTLSAFSANAAFSLIHKVGLMSQVPIGVLVGYMLPHLTAKFGSGRAKLASPAFLDWVIGTCTLAALGVSQLYVLGADLFVVPTLGAAYGDTVRIACILSLYMIPLYLYSILNAVLMASRFVVSSSLLYAAATLVSAVLDYFVVRILSPWMVAYVCASVNWLLFGGFCLLYRARLNSWPLSRATVVLVAVSGFAVATLGLLPFNEFGTAIRIAALAAAGAAAAIMAVRGKYLLNSIVISSNPREGVQPS